MIHIVSGLMPPRRYHGCVALGSLRLPAWQEADRGTKAEDKDLRLYVKADQAKRDPRVGRDAALPAPASDRGSYRSGGFVPSPNNTAGPYAAVRQRASRLGIRSYPVELWVWK